jgi:PPM family protein phosphatase
MKTQIFSISDRGAFRPNNEDSFSFGESFNGELFWLVIADGMGGHLAGEVASQMFVAEIEKSVTEIENLKDIDWLCWLEIEINRANNKLLISAQKNVEQQGMGTTAVVALVYQGISYIGWVGDSRCYWFSPINKELKQLTVDHTMVQALVEKGAITQAEADTANNKNMLSKAIGIRKGVEVDVILHPLHNNESLLLSTDGLHDSLTEQELTEFMLRFSDSENVSQAMLEKAINNGSKDNVSLICLRLLTN